MNNRFIIIDDDISICKILEQIIKKNSLGQVIKILTSGTNAIETIINLNPDIVLIDLLLPEIDGIGIIKSVYRLNYSGKIIMISQVEDKEMISNAYTNGAYFYINKPINVVEVISVINNVKKQIDLENSISIIKNIISNEKIDDFKIKSNKSIEEKILNIFLDIDIAGTSGSEELKLVILEIIKVKKENKSKPYHLKQIYSEVSKKLYGSDLAVINRKAMEQRIRRSIYKAMVTVANLGIKDSSNDIYTKYSSSLFDTLQLKREMDHIGNISKTPGKISTKKFMEGILSKILNDNNT